MIDRRKFLIAGTSATLAQSMFKPSLAFATDPGSKYLVCVFLFGGMDPFDTLYPTDTSVYEKLVSKRPEIIAAYANSILDSPRHPETPGVGAPYHMPRLASYPYALPNEMQGMADMFNSGDLSIVANVGPLIAPTVRSDTFPATGHPMPNRLYSHNDQQSTWLTFDTEGKSEGWGGQFLDTLTEDSPYRAIDFVGGHGFMNTDAEAPFSANISHDYKLTISTQTDIDLPAMSAVQFWKIPNMLFGAQNSNTMKRDITQMLSDGVRDNEELGNVTFNPSGFVVEPESVLGPQLKAVAEMILASDPDAVLPDKQVFLVGLGGFDTHNSQAATLIKLQADLSKSLTEFKRVMELGPGWNQVTAFTASDFGRTLLANGDGTDHGWGGHQFIMGGDVDGGQIHGQVPQPSVKDSTSAYRDYYVKDSTDSGRLIPTTPLAHYVEAMGNWFGVSSFSNTINNQLMNFGAGPNIFN